MGADETTRSYGDDPSKIRFADTREGRELRAACKLAAQRVATWPAWKRGYPDTGGGEGG